MNRHELLPYQNRTAAGRALATLLGDHSGRDDVLVLALPRGGVPVGYEVARALKAPLDVFIVCKIGVPGREELAMGAVASGGNAQFDEALIGHLTIPANAVEQATALAEAKVARCENLYRNNRPPLEAAGRTVIVVDDGLATGWTMRAAAHALRRMNPKKLVIAVPVAARDTCASMRGEADEVVCPATPHPFYAVGPWYQDFSQTEDEEVCRLLGQVELL